MEEEAERRPLRDSIAMPLDTECDLLTCCVSQRRRALSPKEQKEKIYKIIKEVIYTRRAAHPNCTEAPSLAKFSCRKWVPKVLSSEIIGLSRNQESNNAKITLNKFMIKQWRMLEENSMKGYLR